MTPLADQPFVPKLTPAMAWTRMMDGNRRFFAGQSANPNQSIQTRETLAAGQDPFATVFGCSDSRVGAEIIFDQGLGDLFVVRTAGHIVDAGVLGSLEYAVGVLDIPLIVVVAHSSCGAIRATLKAVEQREMPSGFLREVVEHIAPSVLTTGALESASVDDVGRAHLEHTVELLTERSTLIRERIEDGRLGVVGAMYMLSEGTGRVLITLGNL